MTMVFSGGTDSFLVMANDSAIENDFGGGRFEYATGGKAYCRDHVGVVTLWGARDGNQLARHLRNREGQSEPRNVEELARVVYDYLAHDYSPHAREGCLDTGYHVGGFTEDGQVRLYQIAWNRPGSGAGRDTTGGAYIVQRHDPRPEGKFLFNGREDIAYSLVSRWLNEDRQQRELMFPITPAGACRLAHFVLRVCSELTRQVSPPFFVHVLSPSRRCIAMEVDPKCPSTDADFDALLAEAGLAMTDKSREAS